MSHHERASCIAAGSFGAALFLEPAANAVARGIFVYFATYALSLAWATGTRILTRAQRSADA